MAELIVRPSRQDHIAIADLLVPARTPALAGVHRPISRLVLEAPLALHYPQYREAAHEAGTALLIDPLSSLLQADTDPGISWAKLPYARGPRLNDEQLVNVFVLDSLVKEMVDFQVAHGATAVIAPYFYAQRPGDAAFEASLQSLRITARYLRAQHSGLPLIAVFCGSHRGFARPTTYQDGIDRFAQEALELGPHTIGLCLSPMGGGNDSQSKVLQLFTAAQRLKSTGATVIAWRQGFYGPALVAAGLDGYEVGTGINEKTDMASFASTKAPGCLDGDNTGGGHAPVYFDVLGRSLSLKASKLLLAERLTRGLIVCRDDRCCPHGSDSMLSPSSRRQHNIRTRARRLRDLDQMPQTAWRLHDVAKEAYLSTVTAGKLNKALEEAGEKGNIPTRGYEALAEVAELLSRSTEHRAA